MLPSMDKPKETAKGAYNMLPSIEGVKETAKGTYN